MSEELFKEKENIIHWLAQYKIRNYELIADKQYGYMVNVLGDIELTGKFIEEIKVKFNIVEGNFYCNDNELNSLKGAPTQVKGSFDCSRNNLESLEGSPQKIGVSFLCGYNRLRSLKGSPQSVKGDFYCSHNMLEILQGAPVQIEGSFNCSYNKLKNLINSPKRVGGHFWCSNNELTSLIGAPEKVNGGFNFSDNYVENLEGVSLRVEEHVDGKRNLLKIIQRKDFEHIVGDIYLDDNHLLGELQKIRNAQQLKDILQRKEESQLLSRTIKSSAIGGQLLKL